METKYQAVMKKQGEEVTRGPVRCFMIEAGLDAEKYLVLYPGVADDYNIALHRDAVVADRIEGRPTWLGGCAL